MSVTVGCGADGATSLEPSSWSTPMTSRSSSSAWRAAVWMSTAVRSISAGGRSDRSCRAPAWRVISDTRWATTSCISRAMRARSAWRAWSASSRCSASARSGPFVQRHDQLPAGPHQHPPRHHRRQHDRRRRRQDPPRDRLAVDPHVLRAHHEEQPGGDDVEQADGQRRLHAAMHGNGEHGDRRGHRGGHREDRQQRREHRHADRETAAQPQRRTRDHPEHAVDDQHERRWGRLVGGRRGEERGADDGRQQHADHVDGPVPTAAADVPPRLVVSPVEFEQGRRDQAGMVRAGGRPVDGNRAGHAISLSSPAGAGNRPSAVFAAPGRRRKAPSGRRKEGRHGARNLPTAARMTSCGRCVGAARTTTLAA